jgi:hypothetical protein
MWDESAKRCERGGGVFWSPQELQAAVNRWISGRQWEAGITKPHGHISNWDTSRVADMSNLFSSKKWFNQPLAWDTSQVRNMDGTFRNAKRFNRPLAWDTSRVRNMDGTFYNAEAFNQHLDWDLKSVTSFDNMFFNSALTNDLRQLTYESFSVQNKRFATEYPSWVASAAPCVSSIGEGFCRDGSGSNPWSYTSACVDSLEDCLQDSSLVGADTACIAYAESPSGDSDGCGDMGKARCGVYTGASRLPQPTQSSGYRGYTAYAVNDCPPCSSTNPSRCRAGQFWSVPDQPPGLRSKELQAAVNQWHANPAAAEAEHGHISGWDTSRVTDVTYLFSSKFSFNQPLNWDTSRVTNMGATSNRASNFNKPLVWDTSKVTDMLATFQGTSNFNKPLYWDTSKVTTMQNTFRAIGSSDFNQPLIWDTSQVTTMESTFDGASSFNSPLACSGSGSIPCVACRSHGDYVRAATADGRCCYLTPADPRRTHKFGMAHSWCGALPRVSPIQIKRTLILDTCVEDRRHMGQKWDTSKVTTMKNTFRNAVRFDQTLAEWDVTSVTSFSSMFLSTALSLTDLPGIDDYPDEDTCPVIGSHNYETYTSWAMTQQNNAFAHEYSSWQQPGVFGVSDFQQAVDDWFMGGQRRQSLTAKHGAISDWDTSRVTDMSFLFKGRTTNRPSRHNPGENLDGWDTSKVRSCGYDRRKAFVLVGRGELRCGTSAPAAWTLGR